MDRYRKRRFAKLRRPPQVTLRDPEGGGGQRPKVPYQWLRRAVFEGISRPDKRSEGHLNALAHYFGLIERGAAVGHDLYVPPPPSSIKHEADRRRN